jgi:hypothetical protein
MVFYFSAIHFYERMHPLQGGIFRRKRRSHRRLALPRPIRLRSPIESFSVQRWR